MQMHYDSIRGGGVSLLFLFDKLSAFFHAKFIDTRNMLRIYAYVYVIYVKRA